MQLRLNVKLFSAVAAAGAIVAMGALGFEQPSTGDTAYMASARGWSAATTTKTASPRAPETPFAAPTFTAAPCPKRATFPC